MRLYIHGLKEIEENLEKANEKLLAADTNSALTWLNAAISNLRYIRKELEGDNENV